MSARCWLVAVFLLLLLAGATIVGAVFLPAYRPATDGCPNACPAANPVEALACTAACAAWSIAAAAAGVSDVHLLSAGLDSTPCAEAVNTPFAAVCWACPAAESPLVAAKYIWLGAAAAAAVGIVVTLLACLCPSAAPLVFVFAALAALGSGAAAVVAGVAIRQCGGNGSHPLGVAANALASLGVDVGALLFRVGPFPWVAGAGGLVALVAAACACLASRSAQQKSVIDAGV